MLPASVRIFVCTAPQDMRRSFDGLALAARQVVGEDPQSGSLFVFVNKRKNRAKVLWFEPNGYCLLYKRLHRSVFCLPTNDGPSVRIDAEGLAALLSGIPTHKKLDS
jgi:transposase